MQYWCCS